MRTRKLRTFLAMFGIVWGTIAVVVLFSLGQGFYQYQKKQIFFLSSGTIWAFPSTTSKPYQGMPQGRKINIKASDLMQMGRVLTGIHAISPAMSEAGKNTIIRYQSELSVGPLIGVGSVYRQLRKIQVQPGGRFLSPLDIQSASHVIFLGYKIKARLFAQRPAIGKKVYVNGIPFTVVGVRQQTTSRKRRAAMRSLIPYTTFIAIYGDQNVQQFYVLPKANVSADNLKQDIRNYFANRYHFDPSDTQAITMPDFGKFLQFITWIFRAIEIFLIFCGLMTLGVGAVGVANIMFLIVSERTAEIGLRMAVGARDFHIMFQILLEGSLIVLLGGLIGFTIAVSCVTILQHIQLPSWLGTPVLSTTSIWMTWCILAITAYSAAYFPAKRAAKMQPVTALSF